MENKVKETVDEVVKEVDELLEDVKGDNKMKKCCNKKWLKTAAIAAGVALTAGAGYLIYNKYFKKAAVAAEVVATAVEAATEM